MSLSGMIMNRIMKQRPRSSQVAAGQNLTAAVTASGELFTWGKGPGTGHGGGNGAVVAHPTRVPAFAPGSGLRVLAVSLGSSHGLALVVTGGGAAAAGPHAFAWGSNHRGQLGLGPGMDGCPTPVPLPELAGGAALRCVAACDLYSAAVTEQGQLWTWGSSVCLGHPMGSGGGGGNGDQAPSNVAPPPAATSFLPRAVVLPGIDRGGGSDGGGGSCVASVGLGSLYCGCVTEGGALFTWGYGGHGNLGHGDRRSRPLPARVAGFGGPEHGGRRAVSVACTVGQAQPGGGLNPKNPGQVPSLYEQVFQPLFFFFEILLHADSCA